MVEAPGDTPYPARIVQSFSPVDLMTVIRTSSKSLNQQTIYLSIICFDYVNTSPSGYARNDFMVTFRDECIDSIISPPSVNSYDVPLYDLSIVGFSPSQNAKLNCATIYYELKWAVSNLDSPLFSID